MNHPRLTPHQTYVLNRIQAITRHGETISTKLFGSPGAISHLVQKGYVRLLPIHGPRGELDYNIQLLTHAKEES